MDLLDIINTVLLLAIVLLLLAIWLKLKPSPCQGTNAWPEPDDRGPYTSGQMALIRALGSGSLTWGCYLRHLLCALALLNDQLSAYREFHGERRVDPGPRPTTRPPEEQVPTTPPSAPQ